MTPGDLVGEKAAAQDAKPADTQSAAQEAKAEPREKTKRELKIAEWRGKFVDPWTSARIFMFLKNNPEARLEVTDCRDPKSAGGIIFNREGALAVRAGKNVFSLADGNNPNRFKWTDESATLLGAFEHECDLNEAEAARLAACRAFTRSRAAFVTEKKEQKQGPTFTSFLTMIMKRNRGGYTVHERNSVDRIESVYYRCSKREAQMIKNMAANEGLAFSGDGSSDQYVLYSEPREGDLVDALKRVGYKPDTCLPLKIRIEKKGIQVYPHASVH